MKNETKTRQSDAELSCRRKVIILGAGASKPAGVPLINEFLQAGIQEAFAGNWEEL